MYCMEQEGQQVTSDAQIREFDASSDQHVENGLALYRVWREETERETNNAIEKRMKATTP
jgi:hypothetical protein